MVNIKTADVTSKDYKLFKNWIEVEWGVIKQLATKDNDYGIPLPRLAYCDNKLVGGLSFLKEVVSDKENYLWVNSLYIKNEYRSRGIASSLLEDAELISISLGFQELYAFTDKPILYKKRNWIVFDDRGKNFVMVKKF